VAIGPGLVAPSTLTVDGIEWENEHGRFEVSLEIGAEPMTGDRVGRFVCRSLTIRQANGEPVTTAAVRSVPVGRLVARFAAQEVQQVESQETLNGRTITRSVLKVLTDEMVERFRSEGPTDEALWWVSYLYRLAAVVGEPPTKMVERELDLSQSTAQRWVRTARERGLLPPSEGPGKVVG
jgi:hypothetical protein